MPLPPPIAIVNPTGNVHGLYAERWLHTATLPDYPETRAGGFAYIISLQGMTDRKVDLLKSDVYLPPKERLLKRLLTCLVSMVSKTLFTANTDAVCSAQ